MCKISKNFFQICKKLQNMEKNKISTNPQISHTFAIFSNICFEKKWNFKLRVYFKGKNDNFTKFKTRSYIYFRKMLIKPQFMECYWMLNIWIKSTKKHNNLRNCVWGRSTFQKKCKKEINKNCKIVRFKIKDIKKNCKLWKNEA